MPIYGTGTFDYWNRGESYPFLTQTTTSNFNQWNRGEVFQGVIYSVSGVSHGSSRVNQVGLETIFSASGAKHVNQLGLEYLASASGNKRVNQIGLETVATNQGATHVNQIGIEVITGRDRTSINSAFEEQTDFRAAFSLHSKLDVFFQEQTDFAYSVNRISNVQTSFQEQTNFYSSLTIISSGSNPILIPFSSMVDLDLGFPSNSFSKRNITPTPTPTTTQACQCGCSGLIFVKCGCGVKCGSCEIPKADMTLAWDNLLLGGGSTTLFYDGNTWKSPCVNQILYQAGCANNQVFLDAYYFVSGACPDGQDQYCASNRSDPFKLIIDSISCSGGVFQNAQYSVDSASCPNLAANGYVSWTLTAGGGGSITNLNEYTCFCVIVWGCNDTPYPGVTVSVSGPNGSDSEVTDEHGEACLLLLGGQGSYTLTATDPTGRFKIYQTTVKANKNGCPVFPQYIILQPEDDYVCLLCCLIPAKRSMMITMNCQSPWCGECPGTISVQANLTTDAGCCFSGPTQAFGPPMCFPCGGQGPPGCQPYLSTCGCPGEVFPPNVLTFNCPPSYLYEFECVNVNGSCADGTVTDCPVLPCLTDNCGDCQFGPPTCYIYVCCSFTITEN